MSDGISELPPRKQFLQKLENVFLARATDGRMFELTLKAIEEHDLTETHEKFSVIFRGPLDMPPEQGMYSLKSEDIGSFDVFLVPISRNENGLDVEAVFNLVHQPKAGPRSANA